MYRLIEISNPDQLDKRVIAEKLNIKLHYFDEDSEANVINGIKRIFLNERLSSRKRWQEFAHELCHILRHVGYQQHMPFLFYQMQEWQANYFSYHFCIPTFMLQELQEINVYQIMNLFNVEFEFASRRLEMYKNKCYSKGYPQLLAKA